MAAPGLEHLRDKIVSAQHPLVDLLISSSPPPAPPSRCNQLFNSVQEVLGGRGAA